MDTIQHHRALLGICRQRAQMEGENASFWLEEATIRERLEHFPTWRNRKGFPYGTNHDSPRGLVMEASPHG
jgi:hypothetical protein